MRTALTAMFLLVLTSCSISNTIEKGLTRQERAIIRGAAEDISHGDSAALARRMPPELSSKIPAAELAMNRAMPKPPLEITILNANWSITGPDRKATAVYQVRGQSGWALVEARTLTVRGRTSLTGIFVRPASSDAASLNRFSETKPGPTHLLMLLAMMAAVGVTVAALLRIWRTKLFKRRWLWTIGALIGVTTLRMNWSTGDFYFQPLFLQLFSAGAAKSPIYAPWTLSVGLPLIALIALLKHRGVTKDGARVEPDAA